MKIFGILNITPDSFSDNVEGLSAADIAKKGYDMMREGAAYIDMGAESTRPDATPLTHKQEWERLKPVLEALLPHRGKLVGGNDYSDSPPSSSPCEGKDFLGDKYISIDTYHPETAREALKFPQVEYINDVNGLKDPEMARIIAENDAKIILMHSLSVPADKNLVIQGDPIKEISAWIEEIFSNLKNYQIPAKNVIIDVGIGFGKTAEQSIELMKNIGALTELIHVQGAKILVGHSRKSFLSKFTDKPASERDFETAAITQYLCSQNVDYVRVHNVQLNQQSINIYNQLQET